MAEEAPVRAVRDVRSPSGLLLANADTRGKAYRGLVPFRRELLGRIYVRFDTSARGYWCQPDDLEFLTAAQPEDYVARGSPPADPYAGALPVPKGPVAQYDFGANLRTCRIARRYSQGKLGRQMRKYGCAASQATISYHEQKRNSPGGRFVDAAARALAVPAWIFFVDFKNCAVFDEARTFLTALSSGVCAENQE